MTKTNREVFATDPTKHEIPNLGVAKVLNPEDAQEWSTLEWELGSFVCEGEYERGLERILDQFLTHLSQNEQPAVWVSGFFGSGKSHLMRVLEYLWRDTKLSSGESVRDLVKSTAEIERHLLQLSAEAKKRGGLWSAAGKIGAGTSSSFRLAFLEIIFGSAGLPKRYDLAKLAIYLKNEGLYDQVKASVEGAGKSFEYEQRNLYVSPVLAQALLDAGATSAETTSEVSAALRSQFGGAKDISNDEMLDTLEAVLKLQSTADGKLPLTLVVLDEMQQYISDDPAAAEHVQHLVEGCSSRFGSQIVVVATGQAALTANSTLQKLIDRFTVTVALSDRDVETVVRKVVLRKKPDSVAAIKAALDEVNGEISRQLAGTALVTKAADTEILVEDYPLLPTRRRFWEKAQRAIDEGGTAGVLRTQLMTVHDAAKAVADKPLGYVIGGDFIFCSQSPNMLQSGVLLKGIDEFIRGLADGTEEGRLKSRACALIFLISRLPKDGLDVTGVRATPSVIADLLVEDLAQDGAKLRRDVPRVLDELVTQGRLMKDDEEFRLQTEEGTEWIRVFKKCRSNIANDVARLVQLRNEWLHKSVGEELRSVKLVHGNSKTPRKFSHYWNDDELTLDGTTIPLWIRDEWNTTEAQAKKAAAKAGTESSIVFVLLPQLDADAIRDSVAEYAAAEETLNLRPEPQTDEGSEAQSAMRSRKDKSKRRLTELFGAVVGKARVFQGGGNELTSSSLVDGVEVAGRHALDRLFPKFKMADHLGWGKVTAKAHEGAPDALKQVGWDGDVTANLVCKAVLAKTSGAGTGGRDIQGTLGGPPYGWPKDAIDGALLALFANGNISAQRDGQPVPGAKSLSPTQIGKATFYKEDDPPSVEERIDVRGVLKATHVSYEPDQEGASISVLLEKLVGLSEGAGGEAPSPTPPDTAHIQVLQGLVGNQQFRAVAEAAEQLRQDAKSWVDAGKYKKPRELAWSTLESLLHHASSLGDAASEIRTQRDAILKDRLLLESPDPVAPLTDQIAKLLRIALKDALAKHRFACEAEIASLKASKEWKQISSEQRETVLTDVGLVLPDSPDISGVDKLLEALSSQRLEAIADGTDALRAKGLAARERLAKILDPEPKVVKVKSLSVTLKSESDVDDYLAAFRTELMEHITNGATVIT